MTPNPLGNFGFPEVTLPIGNIQSVESVIRYLVGQLVAGGMLQTPDTDPVIEALMRREAIGSTGIGRGIAIPHTKYLHLNRIVGIVGRSPEGIHWPGAIDEQPVHLVILVVSPVDQPGEHLRTLESIVRQLRP
jgi:mannitol/fructose-specific phosphotransferase system IIA component (Ntr-type)